MAKIYITNVTPDRLLPLCARLRQLEFACHLLTAHTHTIAITDVDDDARNRASRPPTGQALEDMVESCGSVVMMDTEAFLLSENPLRVPRWGMQEGRSPW